MAEMAEGTGFLWPNKFHQKGDRLPSAKGALVWRGEKIEVALWPPKEGKTGFFVRLQEPKPKDGQPAPAAAAPTEPAQTTLIPPPPPVPRTSLLR